MLEKLLSEIRSGGTFEAKILADRLGTSPGLVEVMLEHLQRAGLIQPYQTCGDACQGCGLSKSCHPQAPASRGRQDLRIFMLVEPDPQPGASAPGDLSSAR